MKKTLLGLCIGLMLMGSLQAAQPLEHRRDEHVSMTSLRQNAMEMRQLEQAAQLQRSRITQAIDERRVTRMQAQRLNAGFNQIMARIQKAHRSAEVSRRDLDLISHSLRKNAKELDLMTRGGRR